MPAREKVRWYLVCEDPRQEQFFRRLGTRELGQPPLKVYLAPKGAGDAKDWVLKQAPGPIRRVRRFQTENVATMVVMDGDDNGVSDSKAQLDEALKISGQTVRAAGERIAICVPTWNIETWLLWILGEDVSEQKSFKRDPRAKTLDASGLAGRWDPPRPQESQRVPSMTDGRAEISRLRRS